MDPLASWTAAETEARVGEAGQWLCLGLSVQKGLEPRVSPTDPHGSGLLVGLHD